MKIETINFRSPACREDCVVQHVPTPFSVLDEDDFLLWPFVLAEVYRGVSCCLIHLSMRKLLYGERH